ncbi:hypothetical protein RJ639_021221 [Escallonia herrerae]|uniref:EF-hand domain-containing protein n=1 Tax=Escallonia herrerae TaxID=1293975 RepID=A0AA88V552_9ASTE|nr:hypothetical protein RJ639_021221 [Escallonia herrerae]
MEAMAVAFRVVVLVVDVMAVAVRLGCGGGGCGYSGLRRGRSGVQSEITHSIQIRQKFKLNSLVFYLIRTQSPPEKVLEYSASLKSPSGEIFMTPADLMRAVVLVFPPSEANRVREGYLNGESVPGELRCAPSKFFMLFDTNNDGVISFAEYILFVTLLSIQESSFSVAFKMFDLDNNRDDLGPGLNSTEFCSIDQGSTVSGVFIYGSVENGDLLEYFFGKDAKARLEHGKFVQFLRGLHNEILRLEFTHYDYNSVGTISAKDFALSMVASAEMKNINNHGKVNGLLTKQDFQRAAYHVYSISLTDNVAVDMIFYVFDANRDGNLSSDEFLRILQRREGNISQPREAGLMGLISCWLACSKYCSRICHGCLEAERLALLQIKASINHPNGTSLPEWKDGNTGDCCDWPGVECHKATRSVIGLDLFHERQNKLGDWCLNVSLFRPFELLTKLHLAWNGLVICTDDEGVENQLSKLRNLEVLDLRINNLDSRILSSINGLASLRSLYLSDNYLNSSIHLKGKECHHTVGGGRRTSRRQGTGRCWRLRRGADEGGGPVREALGFGTAAEGVERGFDLRWHTATASSMVEEEKDRRGTWGFEVAVES